MIDRVEFKGGLGYDDQTSNVLRVRFRSAMDHLNDWLKSHSPVQIISICQVGAEDNPTIVLYFKRE